MSKTISMTDCPDCGTKPGQPHADDCDIQRCSQCWSQRLTCDCQDHVPLKSVWTGQFPIKKNVAKSLELAKDERIEAKLKQCYYNCFKTVFYCQEHSQTTYVEGMAQVIDGLMIEHGWLEVDDEILDPTSPSEEIVYFPGLRFEGELGIAKAMHLPKPDYCEHADVPFFYRYGWGGKDSPEFTAARDAAMRLNNLMWPVQAV